MPPTFSNRCPLMTCRLVPSLWPIEELTVKLTVEPFLRMCLPIKSVSRFVLDLSPLLQYKCNSVDQLLIFTTPVLQIVSMLL